MSTDETRPGEPPPEVLIRAFRAIGKMLKGEYRDHYTLTEIADIWGVTDIFAPISGEDVDAIRVVEKYLSSGSEPVTIDARDNGGLEIGESER